jgi:hypothetical protein
MGTEMDIRNDTIEMKFCVNDANSRRMDILVGVKAITTNSHADWEDLSFARLHCADKVGIQYFAASRDLMWEDEHNCVVAKNDIVNGARFMETLSASFPLI